MNPELKKLDEEALPKVILKKTKKSHVGHYGSKGKRMVTPASYNIFFDGKLVGNIWGYCQTKLSDGGCGHKGIAFGVRLSNPSVRGNARKNMEIEIAELAAEHNSA
jgi:hypothetical protein